MRFPDPRDTGPEGLLALGGDLSPETLLMAYGQGIFPWPIEGAPTLTWFSPVERGILDFAELHLPRSLMRATRHAPYQMSCNRAFEQVIDACQAARRPGQPGTWITPEMRSAYVELHRRGHAHSIEAWSEGALVGGLYGVFVDGAFAGESMFHTRPNASKFALLHTVERLRGIGVDWMDIQVVTPHMTALGARLVSRDAFLERLASTHTRFKGAKHPFS